MPTDSRLLTIDEFRRIARLGVDDVDRDKQLGDAVDAASKIVRRFTGRRFVFDAGTDYVEYHDIFYGETRIWLRERPIVAITDVAEDSNRVYASTLTENTHYLVDKNRGTITRISGNATTRWIGGLRSVRVRYTGGYEDSANDKANVPDDLKHWCGKIAALVLREQDRAMQGVTTKSDAAGNVTRFSPDNLPSDIRAGLTNYRIRGPQTYVTEEIVA